MANQAPRTQVTPLQRLLLEHMEATGESFNAIAKRGGLPRQTVQAVLYRQGASVPQEATMVKLAKGLGLPVATIHRGCGPEPYPDFRHRQHHLEGC